MLYVLTKYIDNFANPNNNLLYYVVKVFFNKIKDMPTTKQGM